MGRVRLSFQSLIKLCSPKRLSRKVCDVLAENLNGLALNGLTGAMYINGVHTIFSLFIFVFAGVINFQPRYIGCRSGKRANIEPDASGY
jgi:hypothetical protein